MEDLLDHLAALLPKGYRAREFKESDREPMVEARNQEVHPMQQGTAAEWREWERIAPQKTQIRVVIEDASGAPVGSGDLSSGFIPRADGSMHIGVGVGREHRKRGIGSALLTAMEAEAGRRKDPTLLSGTDEQFAGSLEWATKRGYKEIGRRIESYVDLASFDTAPFKDEVARTASTGIRFVSFAEHLRGKSDEEKERFYRELWEAEAPMWDDVPFARPMPHWPYEQFKKMMVDSGKALLDCSVLALDGTTIAGFTSNGERGKDGYTFMTGVARTHRKRGIAFGLKVEALRRAKEMGRRAMLTTNDEPNKSMRGINARLSYQMLPAHVELEKKLA